MPKIYLAISNKKDLELIHKKIKNKYTDIDLFTLHTLEQVNDILDKPFELLVIDSSFIKDLSSLNLDSIKGLIWYLNTENVETVLSKTKHVEVFPNATRILSNLKILPLGSHNIQENQCTHSTTKNNEYKRNTKKGNVGKKEKVEESNVKDFDSNKLEKKSQHQKQIDNKKKVSEKETLPIKELESAIIEDKDIEVIESSLVNTDPYPTKNELVVKQFKMDINHMDDETAKELEIEERTSTELRKFLTDQYKSKSAHEILCDIDPKYAKIFSRKQIVDKHYFSKNKTIGVWSPISKVGVTTFLMNLAIFMGKLHIPITVIEGVTKYPSMKKELQRFCQVPNNWVSYIPFFEDDDIHRNVVANTFWIYNHVNWYPLDEHDFELFQRDSMDYYLKGIGDTSFMFIDLPTGHMEQHTLDTLAFLDELWVISDGVDKNILDYKKYIHRLLNLYDLSSQMVFTKHFPFKNERKLAEKMEIPLLSIIRDLSEEVDKNANHNHPLVEKEYGLKHLQKPFSDIVLSLTGKNYMDSKLQYLYNRLRFLL